MRDAQHDLIEDHFSAAEFVGRASTAIHGIWRQLRDQPDAAEYRQLYNALDDAERFLRRKAREKY